MILRRVKRRAKPVTYADIVAACEAFDIMDRAGIPENLAIRTLVALINVYASEVHRGKTVAVSRAAQLVISERGATILEHGSPRYELTRLFVKTHRENRLIESCASI